jgi:hypothetical protein
VTLLELYKNAFPAPLSTATAALARGITKSKGQEKSRGRKKERKSRSRRKSRRGNRSDRSKKKSTETLEKVKKDQCLFCRKKSHY